MDFIGLEARQASSPQMPSSGPYPPKVASLGGVPSPIPDIVICSIFLALFLTGAVMHMIILQVNLRRGHKFIISGVLFGFCMARSVTMILRIAWAKHPHNVRLAIAAQIFVAAGIVLLFVVNLLFAQRITRAQHPRSGWHPVFHYLFLALYVIIVLSLVMLITAVIQSFYTLNKNTRRIDRDIQLYGQTYYAIVSFLPIPIVLLGLAIPRKEHHEKFGLGRFRNKLIILLTSSCLLCLGATFRVGINYKTPRPITNPASYQSKACFYFFNFVLELLVIYLYIVIRVDKRFWVPNGSHGPGDYSRGRSGMEMAAAAKEVESNEGNLGRRIAPEEEVFDDMSREELAKLDQERSASTKKPVDEEKAIGNAPPSAPAA